jgi:signal transduction histidine kinase
MPAERVSARDCVPREDFAVFAHELRGALTVIAGYTEMLRRPMAEDERLASLQGIRRAIGRADTLCTEVLAGRPADDRPLATREPVELRALAEQVADEQRAATGRAVLVEASGDVSVAGDEQALGRALTNLVSNAVKYSPADTTVQIRVSAEQTPEFGATAVLEVCDRGPGIPADERERAFEPFERLGLDSDIPGTGLGLTVVASVVHAHGGATRVLDNPGGGTIVRIELSHSR